MINHKHSDIRTHLVIVNGPDSPVANDNEEFISLVLSTGSSISGITYINVRSYNRNTLIGKGKIDELIKKISDELNCGILLISHDLHTVMSATDHVICLNGHVCCSGSPREVAKNNEYKALFGEQASQILSRYEHRHDHIHTNEGKIKKI